MCATGIRPTELRTVRALRAQSVQTKMWGKRRRTTRENRRMSECIPSSRASGVHAEKKSLEGEFEASNNLRRLEISGLELRRFDMVESKRLGWIVWTEPESLRMGACRTENDHGETIGTAILRNLISFRITAMLSSGEGFGPRGRRVHWVRLDLVGVSSHCRGWWESQANSWSRPVLVLTRRWMACRTLT
ncbi:hypothetical protein B0H13DRAFT_1956619 [Mycena leptocephala]|nr:hypothetical protein B0H13DRAFT_1956619 [Mycena leptocephala]